MMADQANTLRNLLGQPSRVLQPVIGTAGMPYASFLAAALLDEAHAEGGGGLLLDGGRDALVDAFHLKKRYELAHYLSGDVDMQSVLLSWADRRQLLPATRGLAQLGASQVMHRQRLAALLTQAVGACDDVYVALSHSQAALALSLCGDAPQWLWLVEPSRVSVTECYKAMSLTGRACGNIVHRVVVCDARNGAQADDVFAELQQATHRLFAKPLEYAGQYRGPSCARALRVRSRLEALI